MIKKTRKFNKRIIWFSINLVFLFSVGLVLPLWAEAAVLYLEPSTGQYQSGDTFIVSVKIDTEGECINTIQADLEFSQSIIQALDFSSGKSIISLWVKPPIIKQESGSISFSGGIPGGYCGRVPGDPGISNIVGEIIFKVPGMIVQGLGENSAKVNFSETSQIFLNDGLGTKAKLSTQGAVFEVLSKTGPNKNEWKQELEKDKTLPELFEIEILQEPSIFDGKYFITFSTTDKQTGLDHYEIKEGKEDWIIGDSPYLLQDQKLQSIIKVKAVDKAGNERIAEYLLSKVKKPFPWWAIVLIAICLVVAWVIVRKIQIKKSK